VHSRRCIRVSLPSTARSLELFQRPPLFRNGTRCSEFTTNTVRLKTRWKCSRRVQRGDNRGVTRCRWQDDAMVK
jgi:hypothetical protein